MKDLSQILIEKLKISNSTTQPVDISVKMLDVTGGGKGFRYYCWSILDNDETIGMVISFPQTTIIKAQPCEIVAFALQEYLDNQDIYNEIYSQIKSKHGSLLLPVHEFCEGLVNLLPKSIASEVVSFIRSLGGRNIFAPGKFDTLYLDKDFYIFDH
jgi:hypothetical protein